MDQKRNNTFWGLILEPGNRYEQTVDKGFHISMATLDISRSTQPGGSGTQVVAEVDGKDYILCHLNKKHYLQQTLDLNFQGGDVLSLFVEGQDPQTVHLTGFYNEMEDDEDEMDTLNMSDLSEEEEAPALVPVSAALKRKKVSPKQEKIVLKRPKIEEVVDDGEESDDEDEDDDEDGENEDGVEEEEVEEGFSDEDEDDDDDELESDDDSDEAEEPSPVPLKKSKPDTTRIINKSAETSNTDKKAASTPKMNKQLNGAGDSIKKKQLNTVQELQKTPTKDEKKNQTTPKSTKKTIAGGVMIEDLVPGGGPVAKRGKSVSVYYVGRLKQNNKQFDATIGGPGFRFKLGAKDVIKGWDVGVEGMKVGGKRRITCPPHMAYGPRGSPPVIPPNSALVFDVTLKNVH